jgi:hypothetical protein
MPPAIVMPPIKSPNAGPGCRAGHLASDELAMFAMLRAQNALPS